MAEYEGKIKDQDTQIQTLKKTNSVLDSYNHKKKYELARANNAMRTLFRYLQGISVSRLRNVQLCFLGDSSTCCRLGALGEANGLVDPPDHHTCQPGECLRWRNAFRH